MMMRIKPEMKDDPFIRKLRILFSSINPNHELESVLSEEGRSLVNDQFWERAINYNNDMLPWIMSQYDLKGKSVLEIGCGSGASTLPIAFQAGTVTAYDNDPSSIDVAKNRAGFMGVTNVDFQLMDFDWTDPGLGDTFKVKYFGRIDVILLAAVLEHLTLSERLSLLRIMWKILRPEGILVIYDTPNRLSCFDDHGFQLPFFHVLPDELALLYAERSSRKEFTQKMESADNPLKALYRLGRGVSYHEFDLAIGFENMSVLTDGYSPLLTHRNFNSGFEGLVCDVLEKYAPYVPKGFSRKYLEMVIKKKWNSLKVNRSKQVHRTMCHEAEMAYLLESPDGYLEYLVDNPIHTLVVEVLKHKWSSKLTIRNENDLVIYEEDLFSENPLRHTVVVDLPKPVRLIRLEIKENERSLGNEVWIFGVGSL